MPLALSCRSGGGACGIAPSISRPIPGMPPGKSAGMRCVQRDAAHRCRIFGRPERPVACASLRPEPLMCGPDRQHARDWLGALESATG